MGTPIFFNVLIDALLKYIRKAGNVHECILQKKKKLSLSSTQTFLSKLEREWRSIFFLKSDATRGTTGMPNELSKRDGQQAIGSWRMGSRID